MCKLSSDICKWVLITRAFLEIGHKSGEEISPKKVFEKNLEKNTLTGWEKIIFYFLAEKVSGYWLLAEQKKLKFSNSNSYWLAEISGGWNFWLKGSENDEVFFFFTVKNPFVLP